MTTSYTPLLGLALPVQGELSGSWGDTVNSYITSYVDAAVAGALTVTADTTLTKTTNASLGATSSQYAIIIASPASANITITAPAASKTYVVINTSSAYTVTFKATGQTGVVLAASEKATLAYNGTDFTKISITTTAPNTFTATQTFTGSSSTLGAVLSDTAEVITVSATAATGTINYDVTTQAVLYYTTNASANWTVNFRASSGTSLNTLMSTGQAMTVVFLVTQGATAYYNNIVQIDSAAVTPKYQGGLAWTAGHSSSIDSYVYTIIKTGNAAFTVLASQTQFK